MTGAAGFIGSHFARHLLRTYSDCVVVAYDHLTYAGLVSRLDDLRQDFPDRFHFVRGDICDESSLTDALNRFEVGAIANFAAESHVDRSLVGPSLFAETNVLGTSVVLECAVRCGIQRLVHVSTDEVYGDISFGSFSEDALLSPRNPYAASKAGADQMVMAYHATFGLNASITRSSNNYGPAQHPEKFVARSILLALENKPIQLHGDGLNMRDWIWVLDNCKAIDLVLQDGSSGEIYNVGAGEVQTNHAVASEILRALELSSDNISYISDRQTNDRRYLMNTSKIRALGWKPTITLADGLVRTVSWYRAAINGVASHETRESFIGVAGGDS